MSRLSGLSLEQMQTLSDRLRKVGARSVETDLALCIVDEVEYALKTGKSTESVTAITRSISDKSWPAGAERVDERFKARIVRVALAFLGASFNRSDYTFQWEQQVIAGK